ncbi:MAG: CAP domain-containing protein [Rhodobacteraceae bacterium]|nr:CAP domain-containing protein [Paracoccaceae bacterium]
MRLFTRAVLGFVLLSGCVAVEPVQAPPASAAPQQQQPASSSFSTMLNTARAGQGLAAVRLSPQLARAAQAHATDMAANDYFSHTSQNGQSSAARATAQGYCYRSIGENIAWGQSSEAEAFAGWLASPGHYANIMLAGATDFGLGHAGDRWVMVIGRGC